MKFIAISLGLMLGCTSPAVLQPTVSPDGLTSNSLAAQRVTPRHTPPSHCPPDMVLVDGLYCPNVVETCLQWHPADPAQIRCLRFAPSHCASATRVRMRFCMDRYEWPNQVGALPPVDITWHQAQRNCQRLGRRLCTAREWTFACEGPSLNPYPYGHNRDSTACNIDVPHYANRSVLANPATRQQEIQRVYSAEPSGTRARCVSWAGVHDMTGNVDEWVHNEGGGTRRSPWFSGLKGGYWGEVRTRCRPMTTAHGPDFSYYQIGGGRCCQN